MTSDHAFIERTNRYTLLQRIGAGGMGVVYKVLDRERNAVVALKTMHRRDAASLYRFKREFRALAEVKHPNLVSLHELSSIDDLWFFTMEYIDGVGFLEFVFGEPASTDQDDSSIPTESSADGVTGFDGMMASIKAVRVRTRAVRLDRLRPSFAQLACAVQALHEAGHLHRDIKPSNIQVTSAGRVVLLDFGLVTTPRQSGEWQQTGNVVLGTPAYMSPEQTSGGALSAASDWYSVGVILYEALTGSCPFQSPETPISVVDLLEKKRRDTPPPPHLVARGVPGDLSDICVGLLKTAPELRLPGRQLLATLQCDTDPAFGHQRATDARGSRPGLFIGRRGHLSDLHDALRDVRPRRPSVVHLHGSSGMGKSTLLRQFLDDPSMQDRAVVLEGRCYEQESLPYKALDSVVDALSGYLAGLRSSELKAVLPDNVVELGRVFPVLERIHAIANAACEKAHASDPHSRRRRAFQAFRALLRNISKDRLIIIAVDDLQWGDVDSAVIMDELFRPPDAPAVLFIGTYRTEDAGTSAFLRKHIESMRAMSDCVAYREIVLGPLTGAEAEEMAAELLGPHAAVARDVVLESRGHPYFLRELTHHLRSVGHETGARPSMPVVTLTHVLRDRIRALPEHARHLLAVIAVAGHPIEQRVVFHAAGLENDVHGALERLHLEHLVRHRSSDQGALIECFHDRIREAAVSEVPPANLPGLHHDLGRALESHGRADPENLALHFEAAGEHEKAAAYSAAAGDAASELLAFDWAAELYCRSRALVERDSPQYLELTRKAARAFANAGRGADAAAQFLEAAAHAGPADSLEWRRRAAGQFLASGHIDEGMTVIRGLLQALGMGFPATPRRALAALLWRRLAVRLRGYRFKSRAESAIPASTLARLDTCRTIAEGLAMVDNIRGAHFQARALLMSLRAGEPSRVSLALSLEAGFSATSGHPSRSRALTLAGKAMAIAQGTGHAQALGRATFAHGLTYYLVGEWRLGYEHCSRAVEIFRDRCVGVTWDLTSAQRFQIGSLYYMGAVREISDRAPVLLEDARRRGDLYLATDLQCRDYHLHWLAHDNPSAGVRAVEAAISLWSHHGFLLQHYNAMLALTHCDLYAGQPLDAWTRLQHAWPDLVGSLLMRVQVLRVEALGLRARSALALFEKNGDASLLEHAARDLRRIEKENVQWTRPVALALRAGLAWAANQQETGVTLLKTAADEFERADMSLHAAAARVQLGRMTNGDGPRAARAQADEWMSRQGVRNRSAMASLFAPIPRLPQ